MGAPCQSNKNGKSTFNTTRLTVLNDCFLKGYRYKNLIVIVVYRLAFISVVFGKQDWDGAVFWGGVKGAWSVDARWETDHWSVLFEGEATAAVDSMLTGVECTVGESCWTLSSSWPMYLFVKLEYWRLISGEWTLIPTNMSIAISFYGILFNSVSTFSLHWIINLTGIYKWMIFKDFSLSNYNSNNCY